MQIVRLRAEETATQAAHASARAMMGLFDVNLWIYSGWQARWSAGPCEYSDAADGPRRNTARGCKQQPHVWVAFG